MVSIDLKEAYLQIPVLPDSRKYLRLWPSTSLTSSGSLLRPLHGSPGLPQGYGSDLDHSRQSRHSYTSVPRRLAYSSQLSQGSSPGSQYCSLTLLGVGTCGEPREVELRPSSKDSISRYGPRCPDFQGFSVPGTHRQAYVSQRRISVLQTTARVRLAGSSEDSVLSLSHLVLRGRLRMRALQLVLHHSWDRLDDSFLVSWSDDCLQEVQRLFQASGLRKKLLFP